jgi:hypothetical protein
MIAPRGRGRCGKPHNSFGWQRGDAKEASNELDGRQLLVCDMEVARGTEEAILGAKWRRQRKVVLLGAFYRAGAASRAVGEEVNLGGQSCSIKALVSPVFKKKR